MNDRLAEINELQRQRDAAQTALTQAQTRRESLVERLDEIETKMTAMGVTPETADEKLKQLVEKRDRLIDEAKKELATVSPDASTSTVANLLT